MTPDDLVERVATVLYAGHTEDLSWEQTAREVITVALEQAAKVAEDCSVALGRTYEPIHIAAAIRALIPQEPA